MTGQFLRCEFKITIFNLFQANAFYFASTFLYFCSPLNHAKFGGIDDLNIHIYILKFLSRYLYSRKLNHICVKHRDFFKTTTKL